MHEYSSDRLPSRLTCREVTSHLTEHLDHRLSFWVELRLWLHLTRCPGCRAYATQLKLLRQTLLLTPLPALSLQTRLRLRQEFLTHRHRSAGAAGL